jgi:hypothetical protein
MGCRAGLAAEKPDTPSRSAVAISSPVTVFRTNILRASAASGYAGKSKE